VSGLLLVAAGGLLAAVAPAHRLLQQSRWRASFEARERLPQLDEVFPVDPGTPHDMLELLAKLP
jgi:hypothetical protein